MSTKTLPSPPAAPSTNLVPKPHPGLAWAGVLSVLPSSPGVYWFGNAADHVLYVGKAKNLKNRLAQYTRLADLTPQKQGLVTTATQVKFQVLTSEIEALLIEAELIRLHQPPYNILLKDDKSPLYLLITAEIYPRVLKIRRRPYQKNLPAGTLLGPFPSQEKLDQVLHLARQIFPWCDLASQRLTAATKKLKTNPRAAASKTILLASQKILEAAKEATIPRDSSDSLAQQLLQKFTTSCFDHQLNLCPGACTGQISPAAYQQNIAQLVLFLKGQTTAVTNQMTAQINELAQQLKFEAADQLKKKLALLTEITSPRYHLKPDLILPALHHNELKNALDQLRKILIMYLTLPSDWQLERIEGYDVSNLQGRQAAVSLVSFWQGEADKKNYRLFNIRSLATPNDYQMLKEAISRRRIHQEWGTPDLLVIDGGKGQVRAALMSWPKPRPIIIGLAKHPDRLVIPIKIDQQPNLKIEYRILTLATRHPVLKLIAQIRDEAHRFAKRQHHRLSQKNLLS